jgi:hypothetical protein
LHQNKDEALHRLKEELAARQEEKSPEAGEVVKSWIDDEEERHAKKLREDAQAIKEDIDFVFQKRYAPPIDANPKPLEQQVKEILTIALAHPDSQDPDPIVVTDITIISHDENGVVGQFNIEFKKPKFHTFIICKNYVKIESMDVGGKWLMAPIYNLPQLVERLAKLNLK